MKRLWDWWTTGGSLWGGIVLACAEVGTRDYWFWFAVMMMILGAVGTLALWRIAQLEEQLAALSGEGKP